jgi:tyrosinase
VSGIRRRVDVWNISVGCEKDARTQAWDPVLDAYARGVKALMDRGGKANRDTKPDRPLTVDSWLWAANTHGVLKGTAPMKPLWNQCAHHDRYFLVWHRAYLVWFETMIQSVIGDPAWALPYWDYSDPERPETRELPWEFRVDHRTVNGVKVANPLFVDDTERPGHPDADAVDIAKAMTERFFFRDAPKTGFGGVDGPLRTGGYLEQQPHDMVHDAIGGEPPPSTRPGLMGVVEISSRDPIFWLHHANIDRLWEVWRNLAGSVDLFDQGGISAQLKAEWGNARFVFGDTGALAVYSVDDVKDTAGAAMNYEYESITLPAKIAAIVMKNRQRARQASPMKKWQQSRGAVMNLVDDETTPPPQQWDPVAGTGQTTRVGEEGAETSLVFDPRQMSLSGRSFAGPNLLDPDFSGTDGLIIALMGVRAPELCHSRYVVEAAAGPGRPTHPVDTFSTFGLNGSRPEEERNYTVDATSLIPQLIEDGWDGNELLVRVRPRTPAADPATAPPGLVIGQITIYRLR